MKIEFFHVDAFTEKPFSGNPAGVCLLDQWISDELMQHIAFENGLSETAFIVPEAAYYRIRWFTPEVEVDLCGHATLALAHVLFHHKGRTSPIITFRSNTDSLIVEKVGHKLVLDFPSRPPVSCKTPSILKQALGYDPVEVLCSRDYLVVYPTEEIVRNLKPDMVLLSQIDKFGVIVTAPGNEGDFVSRFFCPGEGIPEDPVTGSAHCTLIPYWSKRLSKSVMVAQQVSLRGGRLFCEDAGDRVKIGGHAVTFLQGYIEI
jgi:predicted PhzF superfamily epimerase YddE/YHI9